jgi:hypothetical protein
MFGPQASAGLQDGEAVILLRKPGIVFVKGGKVAGTSIEVFLAQHAGPDDIVTPISPPNPRHTPRNYLGANASALLQPHAGHGDPRAAGAAAFNGLRRFGVVRDPFEKIRSIFAMHYVLTTGGLRRRRAIDDAWSEADKYCDPAGKLLLTDVVRYEDPRPRAQALLRFGGVAFERLDIREKDDYRKRCPVEPQFTEAHRQRIRTKFAWEIANFYPQHAAPAAKEHAT